jgi:hypothetical protein
MREGVMRFLLVIVVVAGAADPLRPIVIDMSTEKQCEQMAEKFRKDLAKQNSALPVLTSCLDRGFATGYASPSR